MKNTYTKKLLSLFLSIVMVVTALPLSALTAFSADSTIKGKPETIYVEGKTESGRETNLNQDWKFNMTTADCSASTYNDSTWSDISLPHDFSIYQNFTTSGEAESGFLPGGTGWYRKKLIIPAEQAGKRFELNFDGSYMHTYVYVNGSYVGENHYGYNSFAFDITDKLTCDGTTENSIAVKVMHNTPSSRWYSGSGIYRSVSLITTDAIHIAHNGLTITTPNISSGNGTVNAVAKVQNQSSSSASVSVKASIYEKGSDSAVATSTSTGTVAANSTSNITASPVVANPKLWSIDNPNLYVAKVEVSVGGNVVDTYEDTFGFRYFSWTRTGGFSLNGQRVQLNGVCMHHDQGALGSAAYYDAMYRQMESMKNMGVNSIRATHNPYSEDFYKICDELGLLVIEEFFDGWAAQKNGNSKDASEYWNTSLTASNTIIGGSTSMTWPEFVTKEVVQRDVNRASVFAWSLCNEVCQGTSGFNSSTSATIAANLCNYIKSIDTTRTITCGDDNVKSGTTTQAVNQAIVNAGGVIGLNYCDNTQYNSIFNNSTYSSWTFYASETSSAINSRDRYNSQASGSNIDNNYHLTSFDTSTVGWGKTANDSMYTTLSDSRIAGEYVWTGWDYIGEPTPWNGTGSGSVIGSSRAYPNSSYFGIVDTAGFEKDTYYLYRSQWGDKVGTTTHLVTAWDSDNYMLTNNKVPVVLYSNAYKVEIYRNGTLMGTATRTDKTNTAGVAYHTYAVASNNSNCEAVSAGNNGTSLYATFNIAYEAGTLSTKSYDKSGNLINASNIQGRYTVTTPGEVTKITMTKDKEEITADGQSLAYFTVDLTDANGNRDTMSSKLIKFDITGNGEIMGCDNGDQATTQKYQQSSVIDVNNRTTAQIYGYAGKALCIVRSTKAAGSFTVTASSPSGEFASVSQTVTTLADDNAEGGELTTGDINSYSFIRNYTVKRGIAPTFDTSATATVVGSSEKVNGTITWNSATSAQYNTVGDYTISGTVNFGSYGSFPVTCTLHVVEGIACVQNISLQTMKGSAPQLPDVVNGLTATGEAAGQFPVDWDSVLDSQFANVGDIVVVNGTVTDFGNTQHNVTASVRVVKPNVKESSEITNSAFITSDVTTASLNALRDGNITTNVWSNEANATESDVAYIQYRWDTAVLLSSLDIAYNTSGKAAEPEDVDIQYSLNGNEYKSIGYTGQVEFVANELLHYQLDETINPISIRIVFTQQRRTTGDCCVAVNEVKLNSEIKSLPEANDNASLSSILVNGVAVEGFAPSTTKYSSITLEESDVVTATGNDNVAITVLSQNNGVVKIITQSENGENSKTYTVGHKPAPVVEPTQQANLKLRTLVSEDFVKDVVTNTDLATEGSSPITWELKEGYEAAKFGTGEVRYKTDSNLMSQGLASSCESGGAGTTIAFMAYVNNVSDGNPFFALYNSSYTTSGKKTLFSIAPNGFINYLNGSGTAHTTTASSATSAGTVGWHTYVIRFVSAKKLQLYIDGVLKKEETSDFYDNHTFDIPNRIRIGCVREGYASGCVNASIRDFRMYNTAVDASTLHTNLLAVANANNYNPDEPETKDEVKYTFNAANASFDGKNTPYLVTDSTNGTYLTGSQWDGASLSNGYFNVVNGNITSVKTNSKVTSGDAISGVTGENWSVSLKYQYNYNDNASVTVFGIGSHNPVSTQSNGQTQDASYMTNGRFGADLIYVCKDGGVYVNGSGSSSATISGVQSSNAQTITFKYESGTIKVLLDDAEKASIDVSAQKDKFEAGPGNFFVGTSAANLAGGTWHYVGRSNTGNAVHSFKLYEIKAIKTTVEEVAPVDPEEPEETTEYEADTTAIDAAMRAFEAKVNTDKFFNNVNAAYAAYVECQKARDVAKYGHDESIDLDAKAQALTTATNAMTEWSGPVYKNDQKFSTASSSDNGYSNAVYVQSSNERCFTGIKANGWWFNVFCHDAVYVYDGVTTPTIPVMAILQTQATYTKYAIGVYPAGDMTSGLALQGTWHGVHTNNRSFSEAWNGGIRVNNAYAQNGLNYLYETSGQNTYNYYIANKINIDGNTLFGSDNTYYKQVNINNTWKLHDGTSLSNNWEESCTNVNPTLYVLNYKRVRDKAIAKQAKLKDVANYSEGGLSYATEALNHMSDVDFASATTSNVSTIADSLSTLYNRFTYAESNDKVNSQEYKSLRTALDNSPAITGANCYAADKIEAYNAARANAIKAMKNISIYGYSLSVSSYVTALNNAKADMEKVDNKVHSYTNGVYNPATNKITYTCDIDGNTSIVDAGTYFSAVDTLKATLSDAEKFKEQAIKNCLAKVSEKSYFDLITDNTAKKVVSQEEIDSIITEIATLNTELNKRINIKRFDVDYTYVMNDNTLSSGMIVDARYGDWLSNSEYTLKENERVYKWTMDTDDGTVPLTNKDISLNVYVKKNMSLACYISDGSEEASENQHKVTFVNRFDRISGIEYVDKNAEFTVDENCIKNSDGDVLFEANKLPYYQIIGFKVGSKSYQSGDAITIAENSTIRPVYTAQNKFMIYTTGSDAASVTINGELGHNRDSEAYQANWDQRIVLDTGKPYERYWFINGKLVGYGATYIFRASCDAEITLSTTIDKNLNVPNASVNYFNYDVELNKVTAVVSFYEAGAKAQSAGVILSTVYSEKDDIIAKGKKFGSSSYSGNQNQVRIAVSRTATTPFNMYAVPYVTINGVDYYGDTVATIVYNP